MPSRPLSLFTAAALALFVIVCFLAIDDLGHRKLANPDEGRYSVLAREMAQSGDFITPRLNGLKYFEKPPLQYWMSALSFRIFGESEWSARLYTALCGLLCLCIVGYTGARLFTREVGIFSALALMGCPYFMALAEIITLDMGLTFWTTLSLCAFLLGQRETEHPSHRRWLWLAWAATAGAVLSKGLIGVLFPAAALFLYCLSMRDFSRLKKLEWGMGLLIFSVIAAPWFIWVSAHNPEFPHFFFIHEHVERFLTTTHRRVEPFWFFVPILLIGTLPWTFMLGHAVWRGWQQQHAQPVFHPLRFALLWSAFIFLFFSASGSKLPAYILPLFPSLALILGFYISTVPGRILARFILPIPFCALIGIYVAYVAPALRARDSFTHLLYEQYSAFLMGAAALLFTGSAAALVALWRESKVSRRWGIAVLALTSAFMVEVIEHGYETLSPLQSGYATAQAMLKHMTPETRLYAVKIYDQTLPFYLKRNMMLVDYYDEFLLGIEQEPEKVIAKIKDFPADWLKPGPAMAIIQPDLYEQLKSEGLPMERIHQDARRVAIKKPDQNQ